MAAPLTEAGDGDLLKSKDTRYKTKLNRTDLKLMEKGEDQPCKGTSIYVLYTLLKSFCFLSAAFLY